MTPAIRNHGETRLKPATLLHENLPNASLVPRGAPIFGTSRLVMDLVTVNGNNRVGTEGEISDGFSPGMNGVGAFNNLPCEVVMQKCIAKTKCGHPST
jgi:hypothetical protein